MAFDLATMDLARSHEQPLFDDRDITISVVPIGDVLIVEFSADRPKMECDLIASATRHNKLMGDHTSTTSRCISYFHCIATHRRVTSSRRYCFG